MSNGHILLVVPPVIVPKKRSHFNVNFPMGLGYLAAILEKASYKVSVLDCVIENRKQEIALKKDPKLIQVGMTSNEIREYLFRCNPDFVGISSMFTIQVFSAYRVAELVKSVNREIKVILGGAHPTSAPNEILQNKNIDFVVIGEGEEVILGLLNAIKEKKDLSQLESIAFRNSKEDIIIKHKKTYANIDSLPLPAWHLFRMEKYITSGERHGMVYGQDVRSVPILTSRGCPFRCNFCSAYQVFGRKYRYRTSESVLKEIDELVRTYKCNDIYLTDDQFLANRRRALEILDGITKRNYHMSFDAPNGISPWMLSEEIIRKMKQAGFWRIPLAIESGNQWVLDNLINKPVKLNKLPEIVRLIRKYELRVEAFMVVGNVSTKGVETISQIRDSFDFMGQLGIRRPLVSFLTPHAGSKAFDVAKREGFLNENYIDNYYNKPSLSTPRWSSEELEEVVVCERILCVINHPLIYWLIRRFLRKFDGNCSRGRYHFLYRIYSIAKRMGFVHFINRANKYKLKKGC